MISHEQKAIFLEAMNNQDILIVDKNAFAVKKIKNLLLEMGIQQRQFFHTYDYEKANDVIVEHSPKLVLSDYYIEGGNGFDLFYSLRNYTKDFSQSVFILITSEVSQIQVARAAEEDVDAYIIKPYDKVKTQEIIYQAVLAKTYPDEYSQQISKGKDLIEMGFGDDARKVLSLALKNKSVPTLAQYYIGKSYEHESHEKAQKSYQLGLEMNPLHFKCRQGLYKQLVQSGNEQQAYEVLKILVKTFPANLERFSEGVRYAIKTRSFDDIDDFYELFKKLDHVTQKESDYICAGLVICAKYYLKKKKLPAKAEIVIQKIIEVAQVRAKYLLIIMELYFSVGEKFQVRNYFRKFNEQDFKSDYYLIADFIVSSFDYGSDEIIYKGQLLENKGVSNFTVFKIIISSYLQQQDLDHAREYLKKTMALFPEKLEELSGLRQKMEDLQLKLNN